MPERVDRFNISDVFISYSRRDQEFVKKLDASFKAQGKGVWVDYEDIAPSVDWWEEIKAGIEGAGNFIFIISPDSIASEICRQEINAALENGKRFIPLLYREINMYDTKENIHPAIASHNWLYFRASDEYEQAFQKLLDTLNTDFDYLRQHTRLLVRAREWEARGWDKSAFLAGSELDEADKWLLKAAKAKPAPTELHARYINSSKNHRRTERWRWIIGTAVTIVFGTLSIGLFFALQDSTSNAQAAELARIDAVEAQQAAEAAADESNALAFSASLVSSAQIAYEIGDSYSALPFAIAANQIRPMPIAQTILSDIAYQPGAIQWMNAHLGYVEEIAIHGDIAASASRDDSIVLWDMNTGLPIRTLTGHGVDVKSLAFSPDGQRIVSGAVDGRIILWNSDGTGRREIRRDSTLPIIRLDYAPNGEEIAVAMRIEENNVRNYQLAIVRIASGEFIKRFPIQESAITAISYTPDGSAILVGDIFGTITAWSTTPLPEGQAAAETPLHRYQHHSNGINALEFSADGQRFLSASVDDTIGVWQYNNEELLMRLVEHTDDVVGAVWLAPNRIFSAGRDRNMIIWNLETGSPIHIMTAHSSLPTALALNPDSRRAVTGDFSGNMVLWDVVSDTLTHRMVTSDTPIRAIAHHPSQPQALAANNTGDLFFWDLNSRQLLLSIPNAHANPITHVEYTPDGLLALSSGMDCSLKIWDVQTLSLLRSLGTGCIQNQEGQGHVKLIWDFSISYDGRFVLTASDDGDLLLWEIATGELIRRYDDFNVGVRILSVAFALDDTTAFASSNASLFQFDIATGEILRRYVGHAESIMDIAISPNARQFAASDIRRSIIVWDIASGEASMSLIGHRAPVWSIDFDAVGNRLVSSSDDGAVYLWDLETGDILRRYEGFDAFVRSVSFSPDDKSIIFGERALAQVDLLPLDELLAWVQRNRIYRSLTCAEIKAYAPLLNAPLCESQILALQEGENRGEIYFDSEQHWEFAGTAGEVVTLILRADYLPNGFIPEESLTQQRRLDSIMSIYTPDGSQLAFSDDEPTTALFTNSGFINLELPVDGVYRVEVGSFGSLSSGGYTLIFERGGE